jgi:hypothetical protein
MQNPFLLSGPIHSAGRAAFFSFLTGHFHSAGRADYFFFCPLAAAQQRQCAQLFYFIRSASAARADFFFSVRSLQLCRGASDSFLFFLSPPHSRASLSGRHAELIFFSFFLTGHSHTLVSCAQLFVFVSGRCLLSFDSSRSNFFVTGRFCKSCVARAARKIFFCHFRAEV